MSKKPISITSASYGQSTELPGRAKRYLISMGIRTACFIGAIFAPNPYRWFLMVGAVTLPYIAVVIANAGHESSSGPNEAVEGHKAIEW